MGCTREAGEIPKRLPGAELTRLIRRVKQRKLDRGLQSPQLFYTCCRLPGALAKRVVVAEISGNLENKCTVFMTLISCDVGQLYASSLGPLACKHALEKKELVGGMHHYGPLHESQGAARTPINVIISIIPTMLT